MISGNVLLREVGMKLFIALGAAVMLAGCASYGTVKATRQFDPFDTGVVKNGVYVYSKQTNGVVVAMPDRVKSGERFKALVMVANGSGRGFAFGPYDVKVVGTKHGEPYDIHVFTKSELIAEQESRQAWMAAAYILQGLAGSMTAQNAGYSYTRGTYSGNVQGDIYGAYQGNFSGTVRGTYSETTYNPYIAEMAQKEVDRAVDRNLDNLMASTSRKIAELKGTVLETTGVPENTSVAGVLVLGDIEVTKNLESLCFTITTGEETHRLVFNVLPSE